MLDKGTKAKFHIIFLVAWITGTPHLLVGDLHLVIWKLYEIQMDAAF